MLSVRLIPSRCPARYRCSAGGPTKNPPLHESYQNSLELPERRILRAKDQLQKTASLVDVSTIGPSAMNEVPLEGMDEDMLGTVPEAEWLRSVPSEKVRLRWNTFYCVSARSCDIPQQLLCSMLYATWQAACSVVGTGRRCDAP